MESKHLASELQSLVESGSEQDVRDFIVAHFKDFPEETQRSFATALFSEALAQKQSEQAELLSMKEQAVELIKALESAGA